MTPKLKENPKEWWKFTAVMALALAIVSALLQRRKVISREMLFAIIGLLALIGVVLLVFFFLVVLTPIGLALRLLGKDLLRLKRPPGAQTYWLSARTTHQFDRQF